MQQQQKVNTHTIHIFLQASNYNTHYSPMPGHLRYCPFDVALLSQETSQTRAPAVQRNSARFWPTTTTAIDAREYLSSCGVVRTFYGHFDCWLMYVGCLLYISLFKRPQMDGSL